MHHRTSSSRSRPPRKDKIYRNSKEESDKVKGVTSSSLGNGSSYSNTSEPIRPGIRHSDPSKSRSRSRDGRADQYHSQINKGEREEREFGSFRKRQDGSPYNSLQSETLKSSEGSAYGGTATTATGANGGSKPNNSNNTNGITPQMNSSTGRDKDKRNSDHSFGFVDDSRLSKLMHRILRDDEHERRLTTCKQLKEYLFQNENWKLISKNGEKLLSVLEGISNEKIPTDIKCNIISCLGIIGYVMTVDNDNFQFFQWVFDKYSSTNNDDTRIFLLNAIVETLKTDLGKQKIINFIPMLMNNMQSILENADVPELLIAIVEVILLISTKFPTVFEAHFHDTVDILVGWHIDTTQNDSITQFTSDALVSFHQFWVDDINFSFTLLGQFLEDMEAYSKELYVTGANQVSDEEINFSGCAAKITSLIRVYTTVVRSLGDYLNPEKSSSVTHEFLSENLDRLVKSVTSASSTISSENMLIAANDCICLLMMFLKGHSFPLIIQLMNYINQQMKFDQPISSSHLLSLLQLLTTIIREINIQLPIEYLDKIIGHESTFPKLRFSFTSQVQQQFLILYRSIFALKNVPLLEEAYRLVVSDMHSGYRILLGWELDLPYFQGTATNPEEAEAVIIFSLCTIAEIGNAKNSLLGMWALNPSIFDLLSRYLLPTDKCLSQNFPSIQYAVLLTLYSHCSRYSNFILSSCLLNVAPPRSRLSETTNTTGGIKGNGSIGGGTRANHTSETSITSGHFETILQIITEILTCPCSSFDARLLVLKWSEEILENCQPFLQTFANSLKFMNFLQSIITSAFTPERDICMTASSCLNFMLQKLPPLKTSIMKKCVEVCILKITDKDCDIRETFLNLLCQIPLDVTTSSLLSEKSYKLRSQGATAIPDHINNLSALWLVRRSILSRNPLGTFHSHNFRSIMAFILQGIPFEENRLVQLFLTCQRAEKIKSDDRIFNSLTTNNESLLWFWGTWEAAQFCVLSKLRTPFGKPQDTFTTIEAAIKSLLLEAKLNRDDQNKDLKPGSSELVFDGPFQTHLRAKLLLDFIEHLEKLMYNAYEGCASSMPGAPKAVKTFFRTNKATCLEWLTRTRMAVLLLALHMGNPAMAVRQGYQLLLDSKDSSFTQGTEFEHLVMNIVHALTDLHCPEAILGLYVWCKETAGRKFTWMKAAVEQASRRYETAACEFMCLIRNHQNVDNIKSESHNSSNQTNNDDGFNKTQDVSENQKMNTNNIHENSDIPLLTFMSNQVIESYRRLNNWTDLIKWVKSQQQLGLEMNGNVALQRYGTAIDLTYLCTLSKFEDLEPGLLKDDSVLINDKSEETFQKLMVPFPQRMLQEADAALMTTALKWDSIRKIPTDDQNQKKLIPFLNRACHYAGSPLRVAAMDWPTQIPSEHMALFQVTSTFLNCLLKDKKNAVLPVSTNLELDLQTADCGTWNQAIRWSKQIEFLNRSNKDNRIQTGVLDSLHLSIARLARKQRNLKLAQKLLIQHVKRNMDIDWRILQMSLEVRNSLVSEVLKQTQTQESDITVIQIQREGAKLLHSLGNVHQAVEVLVQTVVSSAELLKNSVIDEQQIIREMSARSLLTLVRWIQADNKLLNSNLLNLINSNDHNLGQLTSLSHLHDLKFLSLHNVIDNESDEENSPLETGVSCSIPVPLVPESEMMLGNLLHQSTIHCPTLAKAWGNLASWLYKWGRKAVDVTSEKSIDLLPEEWNKIMSLLPKDTNEEEINAITEIVSRTYCISEGEFCDAYGDSAETIRRHLLTACPRLHSVGSFCLDGLISVWRGIVDRIYCFYKLSAEAYFKFLTLNENINNESNEHNEDINIIATLRLLRLVVKHASELREVLEEGLAHTPTGPWKGIIPQLFARLNHPETYVRQSISDLLCRVAHAAPHLIVFPAVVGSSAVRGEIKDSTGLLGQYLSQTSEEGLEDKIDETSQDGDLTINVPSEEDQQKATIMRNCFAAMVETLSKQDPRSISEVQTVVHELRRITLLWDEFWIGTLNQYHADFSRKISQLENEVKKVLNNLSLSSEEKTLIIQKKHATILKPTLFVLEQLHQVTSQPPETPHESWFQETFGKIINDTIHHLKNPTDPSQPQASWQLYKQLVHSFQYRAQKRSSLILNMEQVSPTLSALRCTQICMPGAQMKGNQIVTIESIDNSISILPTKTKPKKLVFHGSDGCKYVYLFKGLEDLHLDERIMQFISIINSMFMRNKRQGKVIYYARHYSVTPLGPRSGLIQWVDGATPLFGLYKRWQQREAAAQSLKTSSGNIATGLTSNITPRPSEIYYNKLTPLLKEKGITNLDNRKDWPLSVLRQVLLELMEETPKDLLAKELWCSSSSAAEWWKITETYSQSTAVMSMIGYIIGLGDRHLDNVLVDLSSGEVVHIDYNVCFEKGKNLRVPEKVPFRLTSNIEAALGATGIEGIFRVSCEHVIKTMRRGRETLLTLLEAFVYDPLIDWTPGGEGGYTGAVYGGGQLVAMENRQSKLDMEMEITYSMFSIRITEMKAEWIKNRDELLESLPYLEKQLQAWIEAQQKLLETEESLQDHHQQMAYLKEAEANPKHTLYMLQQRYSEFAVVKSSLNSAKELAKEKLNECERWHNLHNVAFRAVTGSELARWCNEAAKAFDFPPSFTPVIDFLHTAGQGQLLNQCEQADNELANLLHQHQTILRACLDTLTTYATIVVQFPPSYLEQNRSYKWQQWLLELICNFTLTQCQEIINKFHTEFGLDRTDVNVVQTVFSVEYQLQAIINDTNTSLLKLYEKMRIEGLDNSTLLASNTDEARKAIHQFVKDNNKIGVNSFKCVWLTALCSLNKRCLMMEGAAFAAGDRLVDLTSRDGDWFLDEVHSISNNIIELLTLKNNCQVSDSDIYKAVECVTAVHHVVQSLQDLHLNFLTIILPEALKHIQSEESSVIQALQMLTTSVMQVGIPLDTLVNQLEIHMRSVVMEMEPPNSEAVSLVNILKNKFTSFVKAPSENGGLSPGQMLLMGFNGLFTKLEQDFSDALNTMKTLVLPLCWKKVDLVKEAKTLIAPVFLDSALAILRDIFFVKRLQAMQDFFALAQQHSRALLTGILKYPIDSVTFGAVYNDDHLTRPIKKFIAEFVRKQMLGLLSQSLCHIICLYIRNCGVDVTAEIELRDIGAESKVALEELCRKAVDLAVKEDEFKPSHLNQAGALISTFEAMWKKQDIARRLEQNIMTLKASLQRVQLQLASHQWLHEDILLHSNVGGLHSLAAPSRGTVMSEMRKSMQALLTVESSLIVARDRYHNLVSSVEQRLKWAVGANPSVTDILDNFGQSIAARTELITNMTKIGGEITTTCSTVLHFEALRTRTSEAVSSDNGFLQLINRCQESCLLAESCKTTVTPLEEKLVALKSLEGQTVTVDWIANVTNLVTEATNEIQAVLNEQKINTYCCWDGIKNQIVNIRSQLTTHHRLMTDIRAILKSMAKYEEQECGCPVHGVKHYMQMYKAYSEKFTTFIREILSDEFTVEEVQGFIIIIRQLSEDTSSIYQDVLQFALPLTDETPTAVVCSSGEIGDKDSDTQLHSKDDSLCVTSLRMAVSPHKHLSICRSELFSGTSPASQNLNRSSGATKKSTVTRDPRTGKALQERNSYAVSVWRRVKMKLDGRDPDVNRRSTVAEQVDFVLKEAINLDNLAVLYEGWTPWV